MQRTIGKRTSTAAGAALVLMASLCGSGAAPALTALAGDGATAPDPLNATYLIQGEPIGLRDGRFEAAAAPGSASRRIVQVLGTPARSDLDRDGRDDYALALVDDAGGSGTFYYVAAALGAANGFRGTDALLIGDRVEIRSIVAGNGTITVRYLARKPGEAMTVAPSVLMAARFKLDGSALRAANAQAVAEPVFKGWVIVGHEVRTFLPCSRTDELWLLGEDEVQKAIARAHAAAATGKRPYLPVFMELTGRIWGPPKEGFGARYDGAFFATNLLDVRPGAICHADRLVLRTPTAGDVVRSPLVVEGRAQATWFGDGLLAIALLDADGETIARSHAVATGNADQDGFRGFRGTLEFPGRRKLAATLVISEHHPDKGPEARQASRLPVVIP